jgi:hypothetical protein
MIVFFALEILGISVGAASQMILKKVHQEKPNNSPKL